MPAVPINTLRANLNWSTESGNEIAVTALHLHSDVADWASSLQDIVDGVGGAFNTHWGDLGAYHATTCKLKSIDLYGLNPTTGKASDKATWSPGESSLAGTGSGGMLPPSTAVVVQLWGYPIAGFVENQRRHRGRIFLPGMVQGALNPATGLVSDTVMAGLGGAWGAVINAINAAEHAGQGLATVAILSRRDQSLNNVQGVTVAQLPAVQRRRINALASNRGPSTAITW